MTTLISLLDLTLWGLLVVTTSLIVFKTVELSAPQRWGHTLQATSHQQADVALERLERWLVLLAVIAATAAFVGLAGTVAHIMRALTQMRGSSMDISVISGPIAASLKATLLGLASAIPAAAGHQLFQRRLLVLDGRMRRGLSHEA